MTGTDGAADEFLGDAVGIALWAVDRRAVARPFHSETLGPIRGSAATVVRRSLLADGSMWA